MSVQLMSGQIMSDKVDIFHTYQIGCTFGGDITCAVIVLLIGVFLDADSESPSMTQGKNASLES